MRIESPYPNGHIIATIDGTQPTLLMPKNEGRPFWVIGGQKLRFVSYSSDYSLGGEEVVINFVNLPVFNINFTYSGSGSATSGFFNNLRHSSNTVVQMTPLPSAGWAFERWSGDFESTDPILTFTITKDVSVRAHFIPAGVSVSARRVQNDFLLLQFNAVAELDYHVQSSTNLTDWSTTQTLTLKAGTVDAFVQLEPSGAKSFRVVSTPRSQLPPS
jgi:hypothetical protein